jgi:serine/threonine protein kinase
VEEKNSRMAASSGAQYLSSFVSQQVGYNRFFCDSRYQNLRPIGDGSYGFVASGVDTRTGNKVAIKKIKDVFVDVVDAKRILREIKLLRHFNSHENIITINDIFSVNPDSRVYEDVYIVTNLYESDLERIIQSQQVLTDQHFQYFLYQILRALKYIHSANVLHRDLKPSNILVNANCDLGLCDFGLARGFDVEGKDTLTEYVVTRWYRAPELLCETNHYGKGVDIWSVGCIFAELLTHQAFFRGENPQHQLEIIVSKIGCPSNEKLGFIRPEARQFLQQSAARSSPQPFNAYFPPNTNTAAMDILEKMLKFLPEERITVEEALAHHYLKDFHGQMEEPSCRALFDFDFEKNDRLSVGSEEANRQEVRDSIFEEVLRFRPAALAAVSEASNRNNAEAKNGEAYQADFKGGDAKGGMQFKDEKDAGGMEYE